MYNNILLAYDGSAAGQQALLNSKDLAQWHDGKLHLLAVMPYDLVALGPENVYYNPDDQKAEEERYRAILEAGIAQLKSMGVAATGELVHGDPVDQIIHVAEKTHADLIVLGHKHRHSWLERWWRGSISKALIELAPCSVLVVIT
jgi:nucleotide-binding universal stress UspA family protein